MLRVEKLTKRFGGMSAISDVSFNVDKGQVYSVIGPNGAGKTTLFNVISGIYMPTQGRVSFLEKDVGSLPPNCLATMGMSRTFQNLQVCMNMTALENVMVGAHLKLSQRFLPAMLRLPSIAKADREIREKCAALMEFVGIGQYITAHARSLPYGILKRLEIARALAAESTLLLLDEPAAGLNHTETHEIAELIQKIVNEDMTVILVEHDMQMVMNISDRILVLNYGRWLAEGSPAEIQANPEVIAAYLGAVA